MDEEIHHKEDLDISESEMEDALTFNSDEEDGLTLLNHDSQDQEIEEYAKGLKKVLESEESLLASKEDKLKKCWSHLKEESASNDKVLNELGLAPKWAVVIYQLVATANGKMDQILMGHGVKNNMNSVSPSQWQTVTNKESMKCKKSNKRDLWKSSESKRKLGDSLKKKKSRNVKSSKKKTTNDDIEALGTSKESGVAPLAETPSNIRLPEDNHPASNEHDIKERFPVESLSALECISTEQVCQGQIHDNIAEFLRTKNVSSGYFGSTSGPPSTTSMESGVADNSSNQDNHPASNGHDIKERFTVESLSASERISMEQVRQGQILDNIFEFLRTKNAYFGSISGPPSTILQSPLMEVNQDPFSSALAPVRNGGKRCQCNCHNLGMR